MLQSFSKLKQSFSDGDSKSVKRFMLFVKFEKKKKKREREKDYTQQWKQPRAYHPTEWWFIDDACQHLF